MTSLRAALVAVVVAAAFACGSFGEGDEPKATPDAPVDGSVDDARVDPVSDATIGPVDGPATDGGRDGAVGACAGKPSLFCADFEEAALPAGFTTERTYGDPISMTLTAPPNRKLAVVLPNGSLASNHVLERILTLPAAFELSFELSASTTFDGQYVEIIDVQHATTNARFTAVLDNGVVKAAIHLPGQLPYDRRLEMGPVPSAPTRFSMRLTPTMMVVQRGGVPTNEVELEGAAVGALAGPCVFTAGVYFADPPKDGAFQLDDVRLAQ